MKNLCKIITITLILSQLESQELISIGNQEVASTPLEKGTIFISTTGEGTICTIKKPCNIEILSINKKKVPINAGDVVFIRGGVYKYSMKSIKRIYLKGGTKDQPITYESYPGELAIFDGSELNIQNRNKREWREGRLELRDSFINLRKVEVRNMPQYGVRIFGNHNIVEGCTVHNNHLSGIEILNHKESNLSKDTGGSYNIVQHNIIYNNSDVGLQYGNYNQGGNADGITIHSGINNTLQYNTIYDNSDDGIDTYKSMNSIVKYNLIYNHGKGRYGNANGIKVIGSNALISHNIIYHNKGYGITVHTNENNATIEYNTAYANGKTGFSILDDTTLNYNISHQNILGDYTWSKGKEQKNNSWQIKHKLVNFKSFNHFSPNFLRPSKQSNLKRIGAYGVK